MAFKFWWHFSFGDKSFLVPYLPTYLCYSSDSSDSSDTSDTSDSSNINDSSDSSDRNDSSDSSDKKTFSPANFFHKKNFLTKKK